MGNGPRGKAGLASMETLDDSTKDPWGNGTDEKTTVDAPEKGVEDNDKKESLIASIRNYNCSIGELLLIFYLELFTKDAFHNL
jgi:hypothetical protein